MHLVQYITVEKKRNIRKEVSDWFASKCEYASSSKDYTNDLTIHNDRVFDSLQEAITFMDNHYASAYDDHAISFHDGSYVSPSNKLKNIQERITKNDQARSNYIFNTKIQNHKSKSITCSCCGSRLTLSYVKGQKCPVCNTDLRSQSVLKRIKKFDETGKTLHELERKEEMKLSKKGPIKWLVKVEAYV